MEHLIPQEWFTGLPQWQLLILVAIAMAALGKASDVVVEGASGLASVLGISKIVIGATIVGAVLVAGVTRIGALVAAAASGQAAEFLTATALAAAGDNFVSASALYGGTHTMFSTTLGRLGVDARFVDGDDPEAFAAQIDDHTPFLYTEIIGNPLGSVADLKSLGEVAAAPVSYTHLTLPTNREV